MEEKFREYVFRSEAYELQPRCEFNQDLLNKAKLSRLYIDYGSGFNEDDLSVSFFEKSENCFTLNFEVNVCRSPIEFRWDPIEDNLCKVKIDRIVLFTSEGKSHDVDIITSNGNYKDDWFIFDTLDPYFVISGRSDTEHVQIQCQLEFMRNLIFERNKNAQIQSLEGHLQELTKQNVKLIKELEDIKKSKLWKAMRLIGLDKSE
jgi:hypothetical protein